MNRKPRRNAHSRKKVVGKSRAYGKAAAVGAARDSIELLLEKTMRSDGCTSSSMHTMLYSVTESLGILAYKYGFTVGRMLYNSNKRIDSLFAFLEQGGMGKVLYTPSADILYITSARRGSVKTIAAAPAHNYEAGVIAGFMASYTGKDISTVETACVLNGGEECVFASGKLDRHALHMNGNANSTISGIAYKMINTEFGNGADFYTNLSIQPLLHSNIVSKLSGLMLLAGAHARMEHVNLKLDDIIARAGAFIGAQARLTKNTKAKKSIVVRYNSFSSVDYVSLTVPLFVGIIGSGCRRKVSSVIRNGAYTVKMDFSM